MRVLKASYRLICVCEITGKICFPGSEDFLFWCEIKLIGKNKEYNLEKYTH
jgi:hypothetical protein